MSPDVPPRTPLRTAAELNAAIRALWTGPGGHPTLRLTDEQREEYGRLLAELRQVERGDVVEAA
ncbi:hypothetical protein ACFW2V_02340 [Streptomyces sp. NPDC058947]|uniref:hypothetical protein n=1 Tax=Streptomyces sp. NPDC058947 TaxID=3346675 RepID=UPI00369B5B0D